MSVLEIVLSILSALGTISAIFFGYKAFARSNSTEDVEDGQNSGIILTELKHIKTTLDEIKHQNEKRDEQYLTVIERLAKLEQSTKQAHHRIDTVEGTLRKNDISE